eukprot:TRINITY_DN6163_c0_g1_i1.p2 TRINITY_DN6163_c0_g1~~TRINITY_DN6163_c0_g1_i1.p2  ORF type:complete len:397 (+),score=48.36 TRINITY_DN6163_c0_g1_i1:1392-2582(+)
MKVAVIGGGISGNAIAQGLKGVCDVTVYEADTGPDVREQGYSITIQQKGRSALKELGVKRLVQDTGAKAMLHPQVIIRGDGTVAVSHGDSKRRPGKDTNVYLPRQKLRKFLSTGVTTEWGSALEKIDAKGRLFFKDKREPVTPDLVIACDGSRSTVRGLISSETHLEYLGVFSICGVARRPKEPNVLSRDGSVQILQDEVRLFTKPFEGGTHIMWQLTFKSDEDDARKSSTKVGEGLSDRKQKCLTTALSMTSSWSTEITHVLQSTPVETIRGGAMYDISTLQCKRLMQCVPRGIVFVGDSVHPMSPFKGQGANTALQDAALVVGMIKACRGDADALHKQVTLYHQALPGRVSHAVAGSRRNVCFLHSPEAADDDALKSFLTAPKESWLGKALNSF